MADLTYDQFASNVRASYPQLDEASIKSAYSSQYGQDAVRTSGPSLADFSANVKKTYPDLPDSHIEDAYKSAYGTDFLTAGKRKAVSTYADTLVPLGQGISKLGETFGSEGLVKAGQRVTDYWNDVGANNAPARADQKFSLTNPNSYAQVLGGLGGFLGSMGPVVGPGEATSRVYEKTGSAAKAATVGGVDLAANFLAPEAGLGRLASAATFAGAGALAPAVEAKATGQPIPWDQVMLNAAGGGIFGAAIPGRVVGAGSKLWGPDEYAAAMAANDPAKAEFMARARAAGPALPAPEAPIASEVPRETPPPEPLPPIQAEPLDPTSGPMSPEAPSPIRPQAMVPYEPIRQLAVPDEVKGGLAGAYEHATAAKPDLDRALVGISKDIGTPHAPLFGPLKGVDRAAEKTMTENEGDVGKLKDLARGTVVADNLDQVAAAIQATQLRFGTPTKLNNLLDPSTPSPPNGFRGVNMNVMLRGRPVEIQVTVPEMAAAQKEIHPLYEEQRTLLGEAKQGKASPEQLARIEELTNQMAQVTLPAWDAFLTRSRKSASRSGIPSEYALAGGNGLPAGTSQALQMAPPSGVPSNETGTPSTSQKYGIGATTQSPPTPPIIAGRDSGAPHELMTKTGSKVLVQPRLVELHNLIHSQHPAFDQALQPRDRSRAASAGQVDVLARNPNLAKTTIVIDHHGQVISGNGRTLAQHRMDSHYPEHAATYRAQLEAAGHETGGMSRPILVRQLPASMSHEQRMTFAREMNKGTTLQMSAAEQAGEDAGKLTAPTLSLLHPGAIESTANAPFVRAWMQQFPEIERGNMLDAEGHLSADGIRRIHNAVLAKAYGGSEHSKAVLARAIESSDNEVRSITGAMLDAAPAFAELRQAIQEGRVPKEFDTTGALAEAVEHTAQMRSEGRSLTETLGQNDAFNPRSAETEAWMRAFHNGGRAASKQTIAQRLDTYARDAAKQDVNQGQLIESKPVTPLELINNAIGSDRPPPSTPDMFGVRDDHGYAGKQAKGGQLALDFSPEIETRPNEPPSEIEAGVKAVSDLLHFRDRNGSVSVLAYGLTKDFTGTGTTHLTGQTISTAADLAALAQVYRDAQFETLRIYFVNDRGQVLDQRGYTSRNRGAVYFRDDWFQEVARDMKAAGASGYWMQHNHPSGNTRASKGDLQATLKLAGLLPGLKGHVVIDHGGYSVINSDGTGVSTREHPLTAKQSYQPGKNPTVPSKLLGQDMLVAADLAKISTQIESRQDKVTVIATDPNRKVYAILEYPTQDLRGIHGLSRLRRLAKNAGGHLYAVAPGSELSQLDHVFRAGILTDAVDTSRNFSLRPRTYTEGAGAPIASGEPKVLARRGGVPYKGEGFTRVADPGQDYGEEGGRFEPGAENDIGGGTYKLRQFANLEPAELQILSEVVENLDGPVADQRRGTRTWDATEEAALKLIQTKYGVTLDQLVNRKKGSAASAEQLEAYAQIISATSKSIRTLADEVVATGSHESKVALAAAKDKLGMLLAPALGYHTEAGRALNILKKTAAANEEAGRLLDALGDGSDASLTEFAKKIKGAGNIDQVIGLTRAAYTPSLWDKIYEGWISGLLSGPTTHAVNITSNALFNMMDLAADAGGIFAKDSTLRGLVAKIAGQGHGVTVGLRNAAIAFKTEEPQIGSHMQTQHPRRAIGGTLGRVVRTPLRALLAADEYFKAIAYHGELGRIAMERAIAEGSHNVIERFNEILGNIQNDPEMAAAAMKAAERATFQTDLGTTAKAGQRFLEKSKVGKIIIPFVRTPTNIIKQAIEFSPGAPLFESVRDAISGGGRDAALAWSRIAIGSGIMLGMVALAMKGLVSGNGPNNPEERALLMRQGWQPYSIKVGDHWYKYNRIDPAGTLLGVAADMHDIIGYAKPEELDKMASAVITSLALNLGDKTFLRGITDFSQAYADPQRYLQRWAQSMAGSVVPNLSAQIARGADPFMRQVDTMLDAIKAKIPGLREQLQKKLDIAGEPIPQEGDLPGNAFPGQARKDDKLADAMLRLSLNKGKPNQSIEWASRSVKLTPEEYADYAAQVQQARWKVLTPIVSSPQFQAAISSSPDLAAKLLGDQWDSIGTAVKTKWLYQNVAVLRRLAEPKAPRSGSPYANEAAAP